MTEACDVCHTPPLYTNNMLTPVAGFKVSDRDRVTYDVLNMSVDTDSNLALNTRRGTGYYKIPSLKGSGTVDHSNTMGRWQRWKIGLIHDDCETITCPQVSAVMV